MSVDSTYVCSMHDGDLFESVLSLLGRMDSGVSRARACACRPARLPSSSHAKAGIFERMQPRAVAEAGFGTPPAPDIPSSARRQAMKCTRSDSCEQRGDAYGALARLRLCQRSEPKCQNGDSESPTRFLAAVRAGVCVFFSFAFGFPPNFFFFFFFVLAVRSARHCCNCSPDARSSLHRADIHPGTVWHRVSMTKRADSN